MVGSGHSKFGFYWSLLRIGLVSLDYWIGFFIGLGIGFFIGLDILKI